MFAKFYTKTTKESGAVSPRPRVNKTGFSKTKTSWLFFPVSSFCNLFMDVRPYLGANNIQEDLCEFFQRKTDPVKKLQKVGRNLTSFAKG